jgi:cell surface protein SprA
MRKILLVIFIISTALIVLSSKAMLSKRKGTYYSNKIDQNDDTLKYPIKDRQSDHLTTPKNTIDLNDPANIEQKVEYDPKTNRYILTETIGNRFYKAPTFMTFDEYIKWQDQKIKRDFWRQRNSTNDLIENKNATPKMYVGGQTFDRIFGGSQVDIRPSGNVELTFGYNFQKVENPTLIQAAKQQGGFDFDMNINMNVIGKIGDKLKLVTNYNTQATFDFENQIKLEYTGKEDEILKKVEAGNVALPLNNSLITGNQSLFGLKTAWQFGRLTLTNVLSQQKSKSEEINIQGGAQTQQFNIQADQYEDNKHFFLGQFFYNNYNKWLSKLPLIQSAVNVTRIEVWVTNRSGATENVRDIVSFMDLAENVPYQSNGIIVTPGATTATRNEANNLYYKLKSTPACRNTNTVVSTVTNGTFIVDPKQLIYEKAFSKKLAPSEYVLYPQLGFISLQSTLNPSDVLSVAYEYTLNGKTYKVGEFSEDVPTVEAPTGTTGGATTQPLNQKVLFLKLLKGQSANTKLPLWNLMMKNIYSLGAYQLSPTDFKLDVTYSYPSGGERRVFNEGSVLGIPIIRLLNLDRLNNQNDPQADGIFDFIPNVTIIPQSGRLIFPVIQPFGKDLQSKFSNDITDQVIAKKYIYPQLYTNTKVEAQQFPELNRFNIKGTYKSSSTSDIYLGAFNLPQGSVKVSSGGQDLIENKDYNVDYNLGRVKILNEGILNSGQPIKIKFENNAFFGLGQVKTFIGNRFDYYVNENMNIGATWLRLSERPLTQKVQVGDDPIRNSIVGTDIHYTQESDFITKMLDKLPVYSTKEKSNINFTGELAKLFPGHSKAVGEEGQVYIDDFEGAQSNYDLKFPVTSWVLASTPKNASKGISGSELFPESKANDTTYGFNRAAMSWYNVDPYFTRNTFSASLTSTAEQSNLYLREITENELFPKKQLAPGQQSNLTTMDIFFNPLKRGPYNFDASAYDVQGNLKNPNKRWGGIMRSIDYSDFEAANIEFIQFWILDPYLEGGTSTNNNGDIYFNLGMVSEDILKDSRKFYENGLPKDVNDNSARQPSTWGYVPTNQQPITNAFDADANARKLQDIGYDGLNDEDEKTHYANYKTQIENNTQIPQNIKDKILADISGDNYHYYRGTDYDNVKLPILDRYKKFNLPHGNSPSEGQGGESYSTAATNLPESEDINRDNALSESEDYFQYRVHIDPNFQVGANYVNAIVDTFIKTVDGSVKNVRYIQYKVPINDSEKKKVGNINDFKAIRFVRMFLNGFTDSLIVRFAKLELTRNQWRRYQFSLQTPGEIIPDDVNSNTYFNVSSVNLEEHSGKTPVGYILPPGIVRTQLQTSQANVQENEQSLSLQLCGLKDGDARAVYKILNMDMRQYNNLKIFTHAESVVGQAPLNNKDIYAFIRLGSDFISNYYEYALPLVISPTGATIDTEVWPIANDLNISLKELTDLKQERNFNKKAANAPYSKVLANGAIISIVGSPDLGVVKTAMLGVRNPQVGTTADNDNGSEKCAEVWFNEMRLSGFDEQGGYAALARADVKLADLGNVTLTGSLHTIGYGSLEQKLAERFRDNFYQYNASTNLELGKFVPKEIGLNIPFFASINEQISNPQYDPYQLDLKLNEEVKQAEILGGKKFADSIKKAAQDYQSIKSWNVTNVRIERPKKGRIAKLNLPTKIENFNVSYSYTETFKRNPTYESDLIKKYRGGIGYNYNIKQKYIMPFSWVKWGGKYLALVRDINFNLLPTALTFRAEADRQFGETHLRRQSPDEIALAPTFNKYFKLNRTYGFQYDITRSINLNFNAINDSRIDEPFGRIDTKAKKDTIIGRIKDLKRTTNYNHNATLSYTVPFNKFPLTDWINTRANYSLNYTWTSAPLTFENYGNTIQNTQNIQINGDANFNNLYNKIKFLKRYNTKTLIQQHDQAVKERKQQQDQAAKEQEETKKTTDKSLNKNNKASAANNVVAKTAAKKPSEPKLNPGLYMILKPLLSLKRINANYQQDNGTVLPGYLAYTRYLGLDESYQRPGWDFLGGLQPSPALLTQYGVQNLISTDPMQNSPFTQRKTITISGTAQFEPITDFKVDINFNSNYTKNLSTNFKYADSSSAGFDYLSKILNGNYSMSFIALNTFFDKPVNGVSPLFAAFEKKRLAISSQLGQQNPFSNDTFPKNNEYYKGYGPTSPSVLIPAFLSTYASPKMSNLAIDQLFKLVPKPNWRISYNGLQKLPGVRKLISQININHAYTSTFNVGSFASNPDYMLGLDNSSRIWPVFVDTTSFNFVPFYNVPLISITEQLAPLIGVDITWKNNLTSKAEYKRSRNLNMSFVDYQLSETRVEEFTVGAGYKRKGVKVPLRFRGKPLKLENDLNFRLDITYRNDVTRNYKLDQNLNDPTRGMKSIGISPYVDYVVNNKLNLRLFFDYRRTIPATTASFPITAIKSGLKIRFSLGN